MSTSMRLLTLLTTELYLNYFIARIALLRIYGPMAVCDSILGNQVEFRPRSSRESESESIPTNMACGMQHDT